MSRTAFLRAVKGDGAEMLGAAPDGNVHEIELITALTRTGFSSFREMRH